MTSNRPKPAKPPIKCIPCRVKVDDLWYFVRSNGDVHPYDSTTMTVNQSILLDEIEAKYIRREASRLRRNRNARERNQAMRDLGMVKTPYGWE